MDVSWWWLLIAAGLGAVLLVGYWVILGIVFGEMINDQPEEHDVETHPQPLEGGQ